MLRTTPTELYPLRFQVSDFKRISFEYKSDKMRFQELLSNLNDTDVIAIIIFHLQYEIRRFKETLEHLSCEDAMINFQPLL